MVRWMRWHCPPDTGCEIRALAVWGRARHLSVTEASYNTDFHTWMGKKHFCFFQTAETGNRTPNSGVKGSGANHYPRTPAPLGNNYAATLDYIDCQMKTVRWLLDIIQIHNSLYHMKCKSISKFLPFYHLFCTQCPYVNIFCGYLLKLDPL